MAVTAVPQRILVPFAGDGSGVEELTWGQHDVWRTTQNSGAPRMVGGTMPLTPGTTIQHIVHLLSFIMSRHQSLRTRIRTEPDGRPVQVLAEAGEVALEIVDAGGGADPAQVARAVRARYAGEPFDLATQWPVRMAVVLRDGEPAHFVAMYPHVVIDGYGFAALIADLRKLDRTSGRHLGPRVGVQPMDLAREQRGAAARRQSAKAVRHWERLLRHHPPRQFRDSPDRREPRYWEATYDSPAAFLAAAAIGARLRVHTGPVLMAAYAVALARVTGISPRVLRTQVSNRFRPDFAGSVSTLVQPGLCVIDVADCTVEEAVRRAWRSQLAAAQHGYYDPRDLWSLLDRLGAEQGFPADPLCYFNDRRRAAAKAGEGSVPTAEEIRAALGRSALTAGVRFSNPDTSAYLNVNRASDTINYTLRVDTHALTPAEQEAILLSIEEVLVSAALDPSTSTGVQGIPTSY
ncbi:hypothetical protein F4553_007541 [Allocatelliglobosispora scoriae]|uniref:Condensation domain-containing protein n=1 Tax=Allocatelliglobosispora scoriae TaxID=643052 RepID=A0A841BY71_9ACTN|nr:condensation domain-containing protein [Allocatelliglobosispora scoriae]MBB5874107.1 hypothetical protein [Allocatelliglobosispora scoriae]